MQSRFETYGMYTRYHRNDNHYHMILIDTGVGMELRYFSHTFTIYQLTILTISWMYSKHTLCCIILTMYFMTDTQLPLIETGDSNKSTCPSSCGRILCFRSSNVWATKGRQLKINHSSGMLHDDSAWRETFGAGMLSWNVENLCGV